MPLMSELVIRIVSAANTMYATPGEPIVGTSVGTGVGAKDGVAVVGTMVGDGDGSGVGPGVGLGVGKGVGLGEGDGVGESVGELVGEQVTTWPKPEPHPSYLNGAYPAVPNNDEILTTENSVLPVPNPDAQ